MTVSDSWGAAAVACVQSTGNCYLTPTGSSRNPAPSLSSVLCHPGIGVIAWLGEYWGLNQNKIREEKVVVQQWNIDSLKSV